MAENNDTYKLALGGAEIDEALQEVEVLKTLIDGLSERLAKEESDRYEYDQGLQEQITNLAERVQNLENK